TTNARSPESVPLLQEPKMGRAQATETRASTKEGCINMSADNWTVCPRCLADHEEFIAKMRLRAAESYGKVPVAEFQRLTMEAESEANTTMPENFREDYAIGVGSDGSFDVVYEGRCKVCDLSFKYVVGVAKIPMQRPVKKRKSA
ncbi:MAG TPA: hypothetical protein VNH83_12570, partial [Bryobacteraceae bacterium]|nr:hypothetical protein [Bryobacteraceae bacterium]